MCRFLFLGLPARHHDRLRAELANVDVQLAPTANARVRAAFPPGDAVLVVTNGGCSCDLSDSPAARFDADAERAKLLAKAWSPAKIERAVAGRRPLPDPRFVAFRDALARVVRAVGGARVLVLDVRGDVERAAVDDPPRAALSLDAHLARGAIFAVGVVHDLRA